MFDIDIQSVAIDRTVRLEVEDHANSVAAHGLLIERVFNNVNRILQRLIPLIGEFKIVPVPSISRLARDPGSFTSVKNRTLRF